MDLRRSLRNSSWNRISKGKEITASFFIRESIVSSPQCWPNILRQERTHRECTGRGASGNTVAPIPKYRESSHSWAFVDVRRNSNRSSWGNDPQQASQSECRTPSIAYLTRQGGVLYDPHRPVLFGPARSFGRLACVPHPSRQQMSWVCPWSHLLFRHLRGRCRHESSS